jgi:hypothetical protein
MGDSRHHPQRRNQVQRRWRAGRKRPHPRGWRFAHFWLGHVRLGNLASTAGKPFGQESDQWWVSGYGIDQAFLRARRLLSRYPISTVIFGFIPDDIRRCRTSVGWYAAKPYFDFKDGRLTLENVPVAPPARHTLTENGLLSVLEHSRLAHSVMGRLLPEWWFSPERSYIKYV